MRSTLAADIAAVIGVFASLATALSVPTEHQLNRRCTQDPDPCSLADSPAVNASIQLASWMECTANGIFPYAANGAWDTVYSERFSNTLLASFNSTRYNYDGFLALYKSFNTTISATFAPFNHGFISTVAVPNSNGDRGGIVYIELWEGGYFTPSKQNVYYTDAAFAVVEDIGGGVRKVVEFRESSNIPVVAALTASQNWQCSLPPA